MAWMLLEELLKAGTVFLVGFFLKGAWRCIMDLKRCMITGCTSPAANHGRGLCAVCYKRAKQLVDTGETSWEILAERGLCDKQRSPFDDAYTKAMGDE